MHSIRLNGPWFLERPESAAGLEAGGLEKIQLPRDLGLLADLRTREPVTLVRKFNAPTGLSDRTRVFLAIPAGFVCVEQAGTCLTLNGQEQSLEARPGEGLWRAEVTGRLRQHLSHVLTIHLPAVASQEALHPFWQTPAATNWVALLQIEEQ